MYLLDTDTLSSILKTKPPPFLLTQLDRVPAELLFTTAINTAEMYFGAYRSPKRDALLTAFQELIFPHIHILSFDSGAASLHGQLKAGLEKKGTCVSEPDLRIAAIALQHNLVLVTGNQRHFSPIPGLKLENWLAGG